MISEIANSLFLTYLASEYVLSSPPSSSPAQASRRSRALHRADTDGSEGNGNNNNKNKNEFKNKNKNKNHNATNWVVLGVLAVLVGIANLVEHHYYLQLVWESTTGLLPRIPSQYLAIPARVCLAATSYVLALYIDVHRERRVSTRTHSQRSNNNTSSNGNGNGNKRKPPKLPFCSVFLPKVGWAFLRILPAYPFLAVLMSFVFLFVVDLWEYVLHLPLDWLNRPIYYGTLYGPFAYTYVYVKQEVVRKGFDAQRCRDNAFEWEGRTTGDASV